MAPGSQGSVRNLPARSAGRPRRIQSWTQAPGFSSPRRARPGGCQTNKSRITVCWSLKYTVSPLPSCRHIEPPDYTSETLGCDHPLKPCTPHVQTTVVTSKLIYGKTRSKQTADRKSSKEKRLHPMGEAGVEAQGPSAVWNGSVRGGCRPKVTMATM